MKHCWVSRFISGQYSICQFGLGVQSVDFPHLAFNWANFNGWHHRKIRIFNQFQTIFGQNRESLHLAYIELKLYDISMRADDFCHGRWQLDWTKWPFLGGGLWQRMKLRAINPSLLASLCRHVSMLFDRIVCVLTGAVMCKLHLSYYRKPSSLWVSETAYLSLSLSHLLEESWKVAIFVNYWHAHCCLTCQVILNK